MSTSKSVSCYSEDDNKELRRGPWTLEEDHLLAKYIANHGEGRWNLLATCSGLRRTGKSCRLRWLNYLKPDVKRGNLTSEEQLLIFELHSKWGNRWSKIAQHLPGRTDNEIKNYWRTRIQKHSKHLKIDADRSGFQEIVRRLWMPRLLQKPKEPSSSPAMSIQNQAIPLPLYTVSQYSAIGTIPTQIPPCMNDAGPNNCLDQHEQNSDSKHKNGSCIFSSESANIPKGPQLLGYPTSQFHILESGFGTNAYDGYHENNVAYEMENYNIAYEMENFNLATPRVAEDMEYSVGDCQMAECNWLNSDSPYTRWNIDELWQFRNLEK